MGDGWSCRVVRKLNRAKRISGIMLDALPAFNCSEEVFAMDILAESRLTFRQGHKVQLFAMVTGVSLPRRVERKPNSW